MSSLKVSQVLIHPSILYPKSTSISEIFANNINKSPDMIEHLEIFIKNQESRTETIDGMMMIEDPQSSAQQNLSDPITPQSEIVGGSHRRVLPLPDAALQLSNPQFTPSISTFDPHSIRARTPFVNTDGMRNAHEPQLIAPMAEDTSRLYQEPLQEPIPIATEEEGIAPEEEEHFADISSLPSCSPPPQPPEEEEMGQVDCPENNAATPISPPGPEPINLATNDRPKKSKPRKSKGYPCKQCDRQFESSTALKYHETAHAMRKFQCEYCDKMFLTNSTLSIHLRIHLEKRPYNCPSCDLQFRQKTDLNYHTASKHTAVDDYRFKCDYCDKKFARKYSLSLHTKLHTGEKNHQCEVCMKSFRASSYLQVHLRTHTGEKPYECSLCKKRFSVKADVRRHIGQVHRKTAKRSRTSAGSTTVASVSEEPSQKRKKGN